MDYYCRQWPSYDLGKGVKFEDGRFSTDDPGQIAIIEANDKFKVFIWPGSLPVAAYHDYEGEDDKADKGGLPALQQDDGETAGSGAEVEAGSGGQGREEGSFFQELEEIVRGSGIIGGKGKPGASKRSKRGG